MTMDTICTYQDNRGDVLIAYLYNDIDAAARAAFETHLTGCAVCRRELGELGVVRSQLGQWAPPEPARGVLSGAPDSGARTGKVMSARAGWRETLRDIPLWAQVAAAMLFVGVGAAAANLNVTYNDSGLTVRTGWLAPLDASQPASSAALVPAAAPWRPELAALQEQLRSEMRSSAAPSAAPASASASGAEAEALLRRVRTLIEQSEQRQQRELALRIAEVDTSVRAQRVTDLRNIGRNLNEIQSNTGVDVMRLYKMTNDLAVRVSQTR